MKPCKCRNVQWRPDEKKHKCMICNAEFIRIETSKAILIQDIEIINQEDVADEQAA